MLLDLPAHHETPDYYPERYKYLAVHAFEQEKIARGATRRISCVAILLPRGKS